MSVRRLSDGYRDLHAMVNSPYPAVGFGIDGIDEMLNGGLRPSQVCMVMAFSHVGKTAMAINMIANNPTVPILFLSLEMPIEQVTLKLTAATLHLPSTQIETDFKGQGVPEYTQKVLDEHRLLLIDDSPDLSMKAADTAFEDATALLGEAGVPSPRVVIFDYLELIQGGGLLEKASQVDKAADRVHVFARKHKTSAVLLHQVGKGEADGGASPLDLGSGRYGGYQNMDAVIGMYAPGRKKDLDLAEKRRLDQQRVLQMLKNRIAPRLDLVGKKYRMDPVSMRLTPWTDTYIPMPSWMERQASLDTERSVLLA